MGKYMTIETTNLVVEKQPGNEAFHVLLNLPEGESAYLRYTLDNGEGSIDVGSATGTGYYIRIPSAKLAGAAPNSKKGKIEIICDVGRETDIETADYTIGSSFAPENVTVSTSIVTNLPAPFNTIYLQGKSKAKVSATAEPQYTTIDHYNLAVGDEYLHGADTSDWLVKSGTVTVKATAVDARGYTATGTTTINVIGYSQASVFKTGMPFVVRCNETGDADPAGVAVRIRARKGCSSIAIDGTERNACSLRYRWRGASGTFGAWEELLPKGSPSDFADLILKDPQFLLNTAYEFQIQAVDEIGEGQTVTASVPLGVCPLHMGKGGRNVALGQRCDYSNTDSIDLGWQVHFNAGVSRKTIFRAKDNGDVYWNVGDYLLDIAPGTDTSLLEKGTLFMANIFEANGSEAKGMAIMMKNYADHPGGGTNLDIQGVGFIGTTIIPITINGSRYSLLKPSSGYTGYKIAGLYLIF